MRGKANLSNSDPNVETKRSQRIVASYDYQ